MVAIEIKVLWLVMIVKSFGANDEEYYWYFSAYEQGVVQYHSSRSVNIHVMRELSITNTQWTQHSMQYHKIAQ